jgi:hypothetical protein
MNTDQSETEGRRGAVQPLTLLEWITATALLLVVLSVGWMIVAAFHPAWGRLAALELEVVVILVLLSAALILVSLVALLHTRS